MRHRFSRLIVAMLLLTAVAIHFAGAGTESAAYAAPDDTITLTSPNNVTIAESDEYATQMLGDPWDMDKLDDLHWAHDFTPPSVSNGVWSATTLSSSGGSVHLQYQNFDNSYSYVGEKDGNHFPVDSTRYSRLWFRMYSQQPGQTLLFFFKHYTYTSAGNSNFVAVQPGWHIYSIDLRQGGSGGTGTWTQNGPYEGLRLDAPWGATNNAVQIDWVRLTPDNAQPVGINWTFTGTGTDRVNLYLSMIPDASAGNEYLIANVPASDRAYTWNATGIAPGTYYIHAELAGAVSSSGPLNVNTAPLLHIDAPSTLSGEDFAESQMGTAWYGANCGQFQRTNNVTGIGCYGEYVQGVPTTNDPQVLWLNQDNAHPIDTARYKYMNVRFKVLPPSARPEQPYNAGTRMTWMVGSSWQQTKLILAPYNVWVPSAWDLRNVPLVEGTQGWTGNPTTLRFDPLEDDGGTPPALPAAFQIGSAHLTTDPVSGPGTLIRWTPVQGAGIVDFFWDHDASGYNGTAIATGVALNQGSYSWDTAALPSGTYYVYEVAHDGLNSSQSYSFVPVIVDHAAASTIFTDVPQSYWAVSDINRVALRGIISGARQTDSTLLFSPNNVAFRSHLSKMVVLAAGWALANPSSSTFHDVAAGSIFYQFIETAAAHGVINGYPCGGADEPCDSQNRRYFRPNNNVTRSQTTKMITISRGWSVVTPGSQTFTDVPASDSLYSYVETAVQHSVISGYPCGGPGEPCISNRPYFRPGNGVTRAQLSKMISRSLDSLEPSK